MTMTALPRAAQVSVSTASHAVSAPQVAGRAYPHVTFCGKPYAEPFRLAGASLTAQARQIGGGGSRDGAGEGAATEESALPFSAIYHGMSLSSVLSSLYDMTAPPCVRGKKNAAAS